MRSIFTRKMILLGLALIGIIAVLGVLSIGKKANSESASGQEAIRQTINSTQPSTYDFALPPLETPSSYDIKAVRRYSNLQTIIPNRPRADVTTYVVKPGDNLFAIAEMFGIQPETVLWGNYDILRDNPQFLKPEQELNILPTDGVYYQWNMGDNLTAVSNFFEVEPEAILGWPGNQIDLVSASSESPQIEEGTWLIVPGGKRELRDWGPPAITRANPAAAAYYGSGFCGNVYEGAVGTGYFIWPTVASYLSGYDYSPSLHPGIDIAGGEGTPVYAADSGVVVFSGWSEYGFGYLIVLDHGNGWQSAYAHLSAVSAGCGQSVARGTQIGGVGNTGNSTGSHLHFEMRNAVFGKVNPWDYVSP